MRRQNTVDLDRTIQTRNRMETVRGLGVCPSFSTFFFCSSTTLTSVEIGTKPSCPYQAAAHVDYGARPHSLRVHAFTLRFARAGRMSSRRRPSESATQRRSPPRVSGLTPNLTSARPVGQTRSFPGVVFAKYSYRGTRADFVPQVIGRSGVHRYRLRHIVNNLRHNVYSSDEKNK